MTITVYSQSGWIQQNSGTSGELYSAAFFNENTGIATGSNLILRTSNGGLNWTTYYPGTGMLKNAVAVDQSTAFVVGDTGKILKTTNAGASWLTLNSGITSNIRGVSFINTSTGFCVGDFTTLLITTNGGSNWINRSTANVHSLNTVCFTDSMNGIVGGADRFSTTNQGTNWIPWFPNPSHTYYYFQAHGSSNAGTWILWNETWVTAPPIVYHSIYCAAKVGDGLFTFDQPYYCVFASTQQKIFLGGGYTNSGRIQMTSDGGGTWTTQLSGAPSQLMSICFVNDSVGYAVGYYGVIYKTTNGGIVGIAQTSSEVPNSYSLSQNYPNPFNPSTKIKFEVPLTKGGERGLSVKLVIYDILGREVATLVNEQLKPGTYEADWDASNFASGIYFYSLQTSEFTQTKKMVLLK